MDFSEQLRLLQAAQGNPALLALVTVDLAHSSLPSGERARLKDALLAAAIPHWCDRDFLAALLQITSEESEKLLGQLRALTVVEPFPARGEQALNVHETARLDLREHLRTSNPELWRTLSARARAHLDSNNAPYACIEALYHLFAIDQASAAAECELIQLRRPEARHALALALGELNGAAWLTGAAEVEAHLSMLEFRNSRAESARLEDDAKRVLSLSLSIPYPSGIARAHFFLGDALRSSHRWDEALDSFGEYLAIFTQLVKAAPSNEGWQRELGRAHSRVGSVHQEQGRLDQASASFSENLKIAERFASADPSHQGWQRELAVAHSWLGGIFEEQGRLDDALAAYSKSLDLSDRLAKTDPSHARWQRRLAVAYSRVGDIYLAQGRVAASASSFDQALAIFERLVEIDLYHVRWQRDLARAHSRVGSVRHALGHLQKASASFRNALVVLHRLAVVQPAQAGLQHDLALAYRSLARTLAELGHEQDAQANFLSAAENLANAISLSPNNLTWREELANLRGSPP